MMQNHAKLQVIIKLYHVMAEHKIDAGEHYKLFMTCKYTI